MVGCLGLTKSANKNTEREMQKMRQLVITGHWGTHTGELPYNTVPTSNAPTEHNQKTNIFNGGCYDRLRSILRAADGYDRIIWAPEFEAGMAPIDPRQYTDAHIVLS